MFSKYPALLIGILVYTNLLALSPNPTLVATSDKPIQALNTGQPLKAPTVITKQLVLSNQSDTPFNLFDLPTDWEYINYPDGVIKIAAASPKFPTQAPMSFVLGFFTAEYENVFENTGDKPSTLANSPFSLIQARGGMIESIVVLQGPKVAVTIVTYFSTNYLMKHHELHYGSDSSDTLITIEFRAPELIYPYSWNQAAADNFAVILTQLLQAHPELKFVGTSKPSLLRTITN